MPRRLARLCPLALAALFACSGAHPNPDDAQSRAQSGPAAAPADPAAAPRASAKESAAVKSDGPAASKRGDADVAAVAREPEEKLSPSEARARRAADDQAFESPLELVESEPAETTLRHPELREAKRVWPEMFDRAGARIDLEEFYVSDEPGSALAPSLAALEAAAARGVKVRLLADSKMAKTYPEVLKKLAGEANIQVEQIDFHELAGGVQHAKFFVVDGAEAYEGSQNFDWRSLAQIQEMGLRFRAPEAVRALEDVFETDWALAGSGAKSFRAAPQGAYRFPTPAGDAPSSLSGPNAKHEARLTFVASPKGWLPDEARWDLPALVQLIDGAKSSVCLQVLTYSARNFAELEDALKRAAARGVSVTVLVSNWSLRKGTVAGIQELARWRPESGAAGKAIEVRVFTIPQLAAGYLPFARVAHAKYLVVDGERAWVGTNNWERDYFFKTRNVGLIVEGGAVPARLSEIFAQNLRSPYAAPVDPDRTYEAPRTGQ